MLQLTWVAIRARLRLTLSTTIGPIRAMNITGFSKANLDRVHTLLTVFLTDSIGLAEVFTSLILPLLSKYRHSAQPESYNYPYYQIRLPSSRNQTYPYLFQTNDTQGLQDN
jgi:hypothetical protein